MINDFIGCYRYLVKSKKYEMFHNLSHLQISLTKDINIILDLKELVQCLRPNLENFTGCRVKNGTQQEQIPCVKIKPFRSIYVSTIFLP